MRPQFFPKSSFETPRRGSQDEDIFRGSFFLAVFFFAIAFAGATFFEAIFLGKAFAFRARGRFFDAARCAAASAALAHWLSSSVSSNSRAGSCQYELTVTLLALV
jgi:hypothetical protein